VAVSGAVPGAPTLNLSEKLRNAVSGTAGPLGPHITGAPGNVAPLDPEELSCRYEERAGVYEFDGGLPRPEAELRAWVDVALDWLDTQPGADELPTAEARALAARALAEAGIPTPPATPLRLTPDAFVSIVCCDCSARVYRPTDPRYGAPARCWRCEQAEQARLLGLVARRGGPPDAA